MDDKDKNKPSQKSSNRSVDRASGPGLDSDSDDVSPAMLRNELNRFLDQDFWIEPFDIFRRTPRLWSKMGLGAFPRIDISETVDEVKVAMEIPGVDPENIDVEVKGDWMRVRGRTERKIESKEKPYRYERTYGQFSREFTLPARVRDDQAKAVYKDGVLSITLPKIEEDKRKKISIEKQ